MGKKKTTEKVPKTPTPSPQREELSDPPPPSTEEQETLIPASKLEEFFKAANPNVYWEAAIAALSQTLKAATTTSAALAKTILVPPHTLPITSQPSTQRSTTSTEEKTEKALPSTKITKKPSIKLPTTAAKAPESKSSPRKEPKTTEPLNVSPISTYEQPAVREEREEKDGGTGGGNERQGGWNGRSNGGS